MSLRSRSRALTLALASSGTLTLGALSACGGSSAPPRDKLAEARKALDEGNAKRALPLVATETAGPGLVLRVRAMVAAREWGAADGLIAKVPAGAEREGLKCALAAERRDVDAVSTCERASRERYEDPVLGDEVKVALAEAYESEHRFGPAEATLRALAEARPTMPNRRALVDYFDRQGYVKDAVEALDAWLASGVDDPTLSARLGQLLERKVRGDLLEKRFAEAEAAARRLLVVSPARGEAHWLLADALSAQGKTEEAAAETEKAKASGAKRPPSVDSFPGMDAPPTPVPGGSQSVPRSP